MAKKYITTNTCPVPTNYKIAPREPLVSAAGGIDGKINQTFNDIDDRLVANETKLSTIETGATGDMTGTEIRDALDADSGGAALDADTLSTEDLFTIKGAIATPRLKAMIRPTECLQLDNDIVRNKGAYHFNGRKLYFASGKNYYKLDSNRWDSALLMPETPTLVTVSSPPAGDYEIKCITSNGNRLFMVYDQDAGTDAYYILAIDADTDEVLTTYTVNYSATVGRIHFAVWNPIRTEIMLVGYSGILWYSTTAVATTAVQASENQVDPKAVVLDGQSTIGTGPSMWILWGTNTVAATELLEQVRLDSAPAASFVDSYAVTLADTTPLDEVYDMVYTCHNCLWITGRVAVEGPDHYYVLCFKRGWGADEVVDEWRVTWGNPYFAIPQLIDTDGYDMFLHQEIYNMNSQDISYNSQAYLGQNIFIELSDHVGGNDFSWDPTLYAAEIGSWADDILASDVNLYTYDLVGKEFDGNRFWAFLHSNVTSASPAGLAVGITVNGARGRL